MLKIKRLSLKAWDLSMWVFYKEQKIGLHTNVNLNIQHMIAKIIPLKLIYVQQMRGSF